MTDNDIKEEGANGDQLDLLAGDYAIRSTLSFNSHTEQTWTTRPFEYDCADFASGGVERRPYRYRRRHPSGRGGHGTAPCFVTTHLRVSESESLVLFVSFKFSSFAGRTMDETLASLYRHHASTMHYSPSTPSTQPNLSS